MDMRRALSDQLLSRLSEFLSAQTGLHFPPERWGDLERGIVAAAREFGCPDAESCILRLLTAPLTRNQIEVLASHLTVGETYFFREKESFKALEEHIFPEFLCSRRGAEQRLRIWSAGCCTGEEPYSVAMLLDRLIPDAEEWNITLLATDINPRFLRKAAEGAYGEWSFRDTRDWIRERYFKKRRDGRFELHPRIRKRVASSYLNLAEDVYPSLTNNTNAMDVILCRNVLMYFTAERAAKVVEKFHRSLVDGGWLIVSPTETSNTLFSSFTAVEFPGVVLYRKVGGAAPRAAVTEHPAPAFGPVGEVLYPSALAAPPTTVPRDQTVQAPALQPGLPPAARRARVPPSSGRQLAAARSCANEGRLSEAVEWCQKALAADKLNPAHHYLLATIQQEQGQAEPAVQSLRRALYLDPDFVLAHFTLGNLCLSQGRRREAERHLKNALALLRKRAQDEVLPEADGLTAGRLIEIITAVQSSQPRTGATDT